MPGTVLGAGDIAVNQNSLFSWSFQASRADNRNILEIYIYIYIYIYSFSIIRNLSKQGRWEGNVGTKYLCVYGRKVKMLVSQSCPTLCNFMACSPPGSSVHGILSARILDWVAIPFSRGTFPTQGSNPSLTHCGQILYPLSHQGSPIYGRRQ